MKYEAWVRQNHKHKNALILSLSTNQLSIFISWFEIDSDKATYILNKRLGKLFDLPVTLLNQYEKRYFRQIYMLFDYISKEEIITILPYCNLDKITKYNIRDVIRYFLDYDNLRNGIISIEWGPGNHKSIDINIKEHYIKHILSEEGIHWKDRLHEITVNEYKNYAQNMFTKMDRVVIHSNGKSTYMSGFYENIFIIGRYHDGIFGISSCYYVQEGEKFGRYVDQCLKC